MSIDFSVARVKHSSWKVKLRGFLDGKPGLTVEQATSHTECDLGKWLYAEGLKKYGSLPEMKSLEKEHAEMHKIVKAVMTLKTSGKTKEAEAEFLKIEPLSKRIVDLLSAVEQKVAKKAA
jgi:methyl-accepting chemotaxis protein